MNNKQFQNTVTSSNLGNVFRAIYLNGSLSRQEISEHLGLSLPTIRQSINELLEMGIIYSNGFYDSTGGRKASYLSISPSSRIAVGVELLRESVQLSAIDLSGMIISEKKVLITFQNSEKYYQEFGQIVNEFVSSLNITPKSLFDINIAVQGVLSKDGTIILIGNVLGNSGTSLLQFQKYINYPCKLVNDADAYAFSELWSRPDTSNAAYLMLNKILGGSIIINGRILQGTVLSSNSIGHMRLVHNGRLCYCGKKGCFQTYCSVNSLEEASGMEIQLFMDQVNSGNKHCQSIFDEYLSYLAFGINNIRMVLDCEFIIGGYLEKFLNDANLELLAKKVKEEASFDIMKFQYRRSVHGDKASSRGAAFIQINNFIISL